jgi:hypothetical protein
MYTDSERNFFRSGSYFAHQERGADTWIVKKEVAGPRGQITVESGLSRAEAETICTTFDKALQITTNAAHEMVKAAMIEKGWVKP